MSESTISHVSDTALWVAVYRAQETKRSDALFRDPFAEILAGTKGPKIAASIQDTEMTSWSVIIRTKIIDLFIEKLVAEGVETVINLGAGLDTRPYRLNLPASLKWIEVDYPHMIELKNKQLAAKSPVCHLRRVAVDLADDRARAEFLNRMGAEGGKALVLTEGVVPYLSEDQVMALGKDLRAQKNFKFWIVDYFSPMFKHYSKSARRRRQMKNAPFRFFPEDWTGFFLKAGWRQRDISYLVAESLKWGRAIPLPWWGRLLKVFASRKRIDDFEKFMAYVVLEPTE